LLGSILDNACVLFADTLFFVSSTCMCQIVPFTCRLRLCISRLWLRHAKSSYSSAALANNSPFCAVRTVILRSVRSTRSKQTRHSRADVRSNSSFRLIPTVHSLLYELIQIPYTIELLQNLNLIANCAVCPTEVTTLSLRSRTSSASILPLSTLAPDRGDCVDCELENRTLTC
jgi:hypothetical protein